MNKWKISRQTLLKSSLACIAIPTLDIMGEQPNLNRVRTAFIYYPNGVPDDCFGVQQTDHQNKLLSLNPYLKSLEPHLDYLTFFDNLWTPEGNGHGVGTATWLTGSGFNHRNLSVSGPSVDQVIAKHHAKQFMLPSLDISTKGEGYFSNNVERGNISWKTANLPCPREIEPRAIFDSMFRKSESLPTGKSILDTLVDEANKLKAKGSLEDQRKLDEYLEAVRSIERQIEFSEQQSLSKLNDSSKKQLMKRPPAGIPENHQTYVRQLFDLMHLGFWINATKVSTFMLDHGQSNRYCHFVKGVKGTWHALSHWKSIDGKTQDDDGSTSWTSVAQKKDMYAKVTAWHHEQVSYFLNRLKNTPDVEGNLLDNCQILYGSNLKDGDKHSHHNLPLILAGKAQGRIRGNQKISNRRHISLSRLHLKMMQNTGIQATKFGKETRTLSLT